MKRNIIFIAAIFLIWAVFAFSNQIRTSGPAVKVAVFITLIITFLIIIGTILDYFKDYQRSSALALESILKELQSNKAKATKDTVSFNFFVYSGFLNTLKTVKVEITVSKDDALVVLNKLRNFNFRWGLLGAGAIFVPFSTMYNYFKQKQVILKALERK